MLNCLRLFLVLFLVFSFISEKVNAGEPISFRGETMGSYFLIRYYPKISQLEAQQAIEFGVLSILEGINARLTTYQADSPLMKWNKAQTSGFFSVPEDLKNIWPVALNVHQRSGGVFDVTVAPLVKLWLKSSNEFPSKKDVQSVLTSVGMNGLEFDSEKLKLRKLNSNTEIDFNAIAPGYAADQVGEWLESQGIKNYLVDIGGELRARGVREGKKGWMVGVETPQVEFAKGVQESVLLQDQSIATSGSYRKFIERGGVKISHLIHPKKGSPTQHNTVSVSVVTTNAIEADAWATALMILGVQEGMLIAEKEKLAVLFLEKTGKSTVQAFASAEWEKLRNRKSYMSSFIITFLFFIVIIAAMAVGVVFKRKPLAGTCGGLSQVMGEGSCEICEKKKRCQKNGQIIDNTQTKA